MTSEELEVLEQRRVALKSSVDSLGAWLIGFIVAVVVGLGIELYRPIVSLLDKFDFGTLVELIGTTLVTLGVAGELAVEWKTHRMEKELLQIDADIEREDKRHISELNLLIEEEHRKRLNLEKAVAPRTIRFGAALEPLREFHDIHVLVHHVSDFEARRTAMSLYEAFVRVGWGLAALQTHDGMDDGISVFINMNPEGRKLGAAVEQYLGHIKSTVFETGLEAPFDLHIGVGFKPTYPDLPPRVFVSEPKPTT